MSDPGNPNDPYGQVPPPPPPGYGPPPGAWGQQQPPYAPQPGYGGPPGYGQPPYGYGGPPAQTDGKAIGALVCAVGAFVVCPVLLAIAGLVLAGMAKRDIEASGGRLTGEGLVTAARIVSWVNIGIFVVVIGFVLLAASVASTAPA